ncbi:ATPase domain protein, prokaryote domain protein [Candidatus Magnetomorum sp. HK-1]|nr:ATPase domain protein, prokaryote domain protein [Candidatus Magnetomorum sp. HK-1]
MQYPLKESIGNPDLFVGRHEEFEQLNLWLHGIPKELSMSTVILARRKSGKTAILQRVFNKLWSDTKCGVIPFFLSLEEKGLWFPEFSKLYYRTFASHYISYFERDRLIVNKPMTLDEIREYGVKKSIKYFIQDVDELRENESIENYGLMWRTAYMAPSEFAAMYDQRILVILDEFQYISKHIFVDKNLTKNDESMPGSYHNIVESKIAPMLVSGSYVGWMLNLMADYLEAGRLDQFYISPYLKPDEGLQAVYKYADFYNKPITNETAEQINTLCMSDPFFIACVIKNSRNKHFNTQEDVIDAVNHELTGKHSRMSKTWAEYINKTVSKINDIHGKNLLLHLCKHKERTWTPEELKDKLNPDLTKKEIHERLEQMLEADLIEDGGSDIRYKGLTDGTLYLVLRHRFEDEIKNHTPDFKSDFQKLIHELQKEKKSLSGRLSNLIGKFAEYQLATDMRTRKQFRLSVYFSGVKDDKRLNIKDVSIRVIFQRPDGKTMEIDIKAESNCGRIVLIEVKKRKTKVGVQIVRDFLEKIQIFSKQHPKKKILPAFLSVGGFSPKAKQLCEKQHIATAETIAYYEA